MCQYKIFTINWEVKSCSSGKSDKCLEKNFLRTSCSCSTRCQLKKLPTCFFRAGGHWTHNRNCTLRMNVMFIYFLWLPRIIVKSLLTHWMLTSVVKCDTRHTPRVSLAKRWVAVIVIEACKFIDTSPLMIDIEMSRYGLQEIGYWHWTLYSKEFDIR